MTLFNFRKKEDKKNMARNLVKEKIKEDEEDEEELPEPVEKKEAEGKVMVVTELQLVLNNLNAVMQKLEDLDKKITEGFKQVGVKF